MINLSPKRVLDENGLNYAVLLEQSDFSKLEEYIEDLEDSLELAEAIKESEGFRLWEDFVSEYKAKAH